MLIIQAFVEMHLDIFGKYAHIYTYICIQGETRVYGCEYVNQRGYFCIINYCIFFHISNFNLLLPHLVYVCMHIYIYVYFYVCISLCMSLYPISMVHNWEPCFPSPIKLRISDSLSHIYCGLYKTSHDL